MKRLLCAALATIALGAVSNAASSQAHAPGIILGVAWYPEQWPEERWDKDLDLMQAAGVSMVRIGEFAWSRMQPSMILFAAGSETISGLWRLSRRRSSQTAQ